MNIPEHDVPNNSVQGLTSAGSKSYVPPCPPSGTHRYTFKVFSLDAKLNLPANSDIKSLEKAMQGHILDSAEIIGLYQRK
jgi:Raf kinase inhibitor-like YbhB/YbcL family protein